MVTVDTVETDDTELLSLESSEDDSPSELVDSTDVSFFC